MQALLQRLQKLETRLTSGNCLCSQPPSSSLAPETTIVERRVVSPPLQLPCPDCKRIRTVEYVAAVLAPAG